MNKCPICEKEIDCCPTIDVDLKVVNCVDAKCGYQAIIEDGKISGETWRGKKKKYDKPEERFGDVEKQINLPKIKENS